MSFPSSCPACATKHPPIDREVTTRIRCTKCGIEYRVPGIANDRSETQQVYARMRERRQRSR